MSSVWSPGGAGFFGSLLVIMSVSRSVSVLLQSASMQVSACFLRLANRVEEGWGGVGGLQGGDLRERTGRE